MFEPNSLSKPGIRLLDGTISSNITNAARVYFGSAKEGDTVRPHGFRPPLVFMVHGVRTDEAVPRTSFGKVTRRAQTVSLANLLQRVDELSHRARFVRLGEWVVNVERRTTGGQRLLALVFDDGLAEVAAEVAPRLAERGIPATIAVVTGCLASGTAPWPYRYLALLEELSRRYSAAQISASLDAVGIPRSRDGNVHDVVEWLHREGSSRIAANVEALEQALLGQPAGDGERRLTIQWSQLEALAGAGWEIVSHSVHHAWFPLIDPADRMTELRDSKRSLEAHGIEVRGFAVPRGILADMRVVGEESARQAGYEYVVSSLHGVPPGRALRWSVPRTSLVDEAPGRFWLRDAGFLEMAAMARDAWRAKVQADR